MHYGKDNICRGMLKNVLSKILMGMEEIVTLSSLIGNRDRISYPAKNIIQV